jgi:hypothetical protein
MRVLIVAEAKETIDALQTVFRTESGYETFVYTILLKALDNIDEINPDIVCMSAGDFPRHWKLFARYLRSPLFKTVPQILLLTDKKFNDEEEQKAQLLGVKKIIDEALLPQYTSIQSLLGEKSVFAEGISSDDFECVFTDPKTGGLVTGIVSSCQNGIFIFSPENRAASNFTAGETIDVCSIKTGKTGGKIQSVALEVLSADSTLTLKIQSLA